MIDILGKTHFRSTSGETSDKKSTQKNFYCTKRFVIEFQGESLELFLSYLVYFRRYRHLRPSSLKKAKIHATVKKHFSLRLWLILKLQLGCDKFRESRNWDSRSTNGLRIQVPGDRKPRIKFFRSPLGDKLRWCQLNNHWWVQGKSWWAHELHSENHVILRVYPI